MSHPSAPPPETYEGPSGIARDSLWLTNEDIPHDRDTVVEIEKVNMRKGVTFQGGQRKDVVLSLAFTGKKRELALNATNRKTLNALFGPKCADWFGRRIALFVQHDVRKPGTSNETCSAVRIRAKRLEQEGDSDDDVAEVTR